MRKLGLAVVMLALVSLVASCAGPQGPQGPAGPAGKPAPTTIKTKHGELSLQQLAEIQPGLGTVMQEYGRRFAIIKMAADAGDWGMAQYQLKEATEIQEVGEITRPSKADMLKSFEHSYLDPLAKAIEGKDKAAFDAAYSRAIKGCNGCHQATGHPYVRVQMPQTSPEPFLKLAPSEPKAP
jgi:cytochrome c553